MSWPILHSDPESLGHLNLRDEADRLVGVVHHTGKGSWWLHPIGHEAGRMAPDGQAARFRSLKGAIAHRQGTLGEDGRWAYLAVAEELSIGIGEQAAALTMGDLDPGLVDEAQSHARYHGLSWPPNVDLDLALAEVAAADRRRELAR